MYKLFINGMFFAPAKDKNELKEKMDVAVRKGYLVSDFEVYQRKTHATYTVGESKLVID